MYYITGDTHGNQILWDACISSFLKPGDTILVSGDLGIGFFDGRYWSEELFFDYLSEQNYTLLFCDGNHENFEKLRNYEVSEWCGGRVQFIRNNVIHLMRGEIYTIGYKKVFVMGGGYSIDKEFRVSGKTWWPEEMPNDEDYNNASANLKKHNYNNVIKLRSFYRFSDDPMTGFLLPQKAKNYYKFGLTYAQKCAARLANKASQR